MGASFLKLQQVRKFALQFLPEDNLKGLKTQPRAESQHPKQRDGTERGTTGRSLPSAALELEIPPQ